MSSYRISSLEYRFEGEGTPRLRRQIYATVEGRTALDALERFVDGKSVRTIEGEPVNWRAMGRKRLYAAGIMLEADKVTT